MLKKPSSMRKILVAAWKFLKIYTKCPRRLKNLKEFQEGFQKSFKNISKGQGWPKEIKHSKTLVKARKSLIICTSV